MDHTINIIVRIKEHVPVRVKENEGHNDSLSRKKESQLTIVQTSLRHYLSNRYGMAIIVDCVIVSRQNNIFVPRYLCLGTIIYRFWKVPKLSTEVTNSGCDRLSCLSEINPSKEDCRKGCRCRCRCRCRYVRYGSVFLPTCWKSC